MVVNTIADTYQKKVLHFYRLSRCSRSCIIICTQTHIYWIVKRFICNWGHNYCIHLWFAISFSHFNCTIDCIFISHLLLLRCAFASTQHSIARLESHLFSFIYFFLLLCFTFIFNKKKEVVFNRHRNFLLKLIELFQKPI